MPSRCLHYTLDCFFTLLRRFFVTSPPHLHDVYGFCSMNLWYAFGSGQNPKPLIPRPSQTTVTENVYIYTYTYRTGRSSNIPETSRTFYQPPFKSMMVCHGRHCSRFRDLQRQPSRETLLLSAYRLYHPPSRLQNSRNLTRQSYLINSINDIALPDFFANSLATCLVKKQRDENRKSRTSRLWRRI